PLAEMPTSLTVAMLRHGQPMLGSSEQVRRTLGVDTDPGHGPDSADWLGVPMRREGCVSGAAVVQSHAQPQRHTQEARALLEFAAQHILTAPDRKSAQEELERRVDERTRELQHANWVLEAEIVERERAENLQRALFRISELSITAGSIERFYADVHGIIDELLDARNFYISLLSEDGSALEFPNWVAGHGRVRRPRRLGSGLTEYVIRNGQALLVDRHGMAQLEHAGQVRGHGTIAHCWLGVPLCRDGVTCGVIAVQSYGPDVIFTPADQDLLTFVAHHVDGALARKRAQEALKATHAE